MRRSKINVLYIEDDEADVEFIQSALHATNSGGFEIRVLEDGEQALKFLNRHKEFKNDPAPSLVLLDLNLPKVHGKDVLRRLKESDEFKHVPVVVLSTSSVQADIDETYGIGASGFITKPANFEGYKAAVKQIHDYWTSVCSLPHENLVTAGRAERS